MRQVRLSTAFPIVIGKKLGHYLVRETLGSGGMGDVYLAEDQRLGRKVALKVLPPEMAANADRRERFHREAKAVAALNHPNIVTIHSVEEVDGLLFITMERIEGPNLREMLDREPMSVEKLVSIGSQIAEGLQTAHEAGILHRDLKPQNVMITRDLRVKLLDFGLAKLFAKEWTDSEASTMARDTSPGMTLGTAGYMAPEQALGRGVDVRADLFALGVVLYEMATGRSPFQGETLAAFYDALLNKPPAPPRSVNPSLPADLARILEKALEKEPARRYQSSKELLEDLKRVGTGRVAAGSRVEPAGRSSVAVLPFNDLSPERSEEYFCHGLAEELINTLAALRGLRVLARTSSFSLHGQGLDAREIGRRLSVETVLEGSVRKAGSRIRITVQLVDAAEGYQIWSRRFDRELNDVFAIQDEIAEAIARELQAALGFSKERSDARRASNVEAYDAYLHGLYAMNRWTEPSVERAIDCFEEAIEKDARFALAHASLAECHVWFYSGIGTRAARETIPRARKAAERALELAPELPEAHRVLALIAMNHDWDRIAAKNRFSRAIELNPGSAEARVWNAWRLALLEGSYQESLAELRAAEALDPLDLKIKTQIGYVHYFLRDFERALAEFRKVLAIDPHFAFAHYAVGDVYGQQGKHSEAIAELEESIRLGGRSVNHVGVLAYAEGRAGNSEAARRLLAELIGLESPVWIAVAHLGLGDVEAVFEWLHRAFEHRDGSLVLVTVSPEFDPLRSDPRFRSLLDGMGLGHRAQ
jgi:serine/threonine-protein kinase